MTSFVVTFNGVAVPPIESVDNAAERYVLELLGWRRVVAGRCGDVIISSRLAECLLLDGLYPLRPHLHQLLNAKATPEYDVNTIAHLAEAFLRDTETLEMRFGFGDCLAENFEIMPELRDARFPNCTSDLERCLAAAALVSMRRPHHSIGVADSRLQGVDVVQVAADVQILENSEASLRIDFSTHLDASLPACSDMEELIGRTDPIALWLRSVDQRDIEMAIGVAVQQSRAIRGVRSDQRRFRLGAAFIGTTGIAKTPTLAKKILRAIVETSERLNMADAHHLRTGRGAQDPQVTRGQDRAWRRDVDDELHLHFWECMGGQVELANIVQHNNFDIAN